MGIAIYPGSFDPFTHGHLDIISRASKIFDRVIVAVSVNSGKDPLFTIEERVEMIARECHHLDNVEVSFFAQYTTEGNIDFYLKGEDDFL
jgi:pantetheine-phosphate adenylyltransferase